MDAPPSLCTIHIPAALYGGLQQRDAFTSDNATDRAALTVFMAAERVRVGQGYRCVLTGEREILLYILDYLYGLYELVVAGLLMVGELGVSRARLRAVTVQLPVPLREAP